MSDPKTPPMRVLLGVSETYSTSDSIWGTQTNRADEAGDGEEEIEEKEAVEEAVMKRRRAAARQQDDSD